MSAAKDSPMEGRNSGPAPMLPVRSVRFTYLDYLELRAWEFRKFRFMPPIADEEIESVDWDALFSRLRGPVAATGTLFDLDGGEAPA